MYHLTKNISENAHVSFKNISGKTSGACHLKIFLRYVAHLLNWTRTMFLDTFFLVPVIPKFVTCLETSYAWYFRRGLIKKHEKDQNTCFSLCHYACYVKVILTQILNWIKNKLTQNDPCSILCCLSRYSNKAVKQCPLYKLEKW